MEEERKEEIVVNEPEQPEQQEQQEGGMRPESKKALISFILSIVGFGFACAWYVAIVGVVLGIVSLALNRSTEQQPFKTFSKVAKPVAIVDIILGAIMFIVAIIVTIVTVVAAAIAASEGAAA